tara:strand:+ start:806 stop:1210 length:405 start_codon:yes stop_codon:yes gene_type:complete
MASGTDEGYLKDLIVLQSIQSFDRLRISRLGRLEKECRTTLQGARRTLSGDGREKLQNHLQHMLAHFLKPGGDTTLHLRFNDVREGIARLRVTTYYNDDRMKHCLEQIEDDLSRAYADKTRPAYRKVLLSLGLT